MDLRKAQSPTISRDLTKKDLYGVGFHKDIDGLKELFFGSYFNILLFALPFAFWSYYAEWSAELVFACNFVAMIPLASLLGQSTECCATHLGDIAGGLLNATFGNAVEIVVMIMALIQAKSFEDDVEKMNGLLTVVQTSLIGSVFSNSLLVLGASFLAHGIYHKEGSFNVAACSANLTLMLVAAFVMMLPAPFSRRNDALMVSRVSAMILMVMYLCLLYFELFTHRHILETAHATPQKEERERALSAPLLQNQQKMPLQNRVFRASETSLLSPEQRKQLCIEILSEKVYGNDEFGNKVVEEKSLSASEKMVAVVNHTEECDDETTDSDEIGSDDEDELELSLPVAVFCLLCTTLLLSMLSNYLVDAIEPMADQLGISEAFIGIIMIPIVGNAVEQLTAVRMAMKNKMDISLSIAIGSATQVSMFAVSSAVLVAWFMGLDLTLAFDSFEQQIFLFTTIIIFAMINDGKTNWFRGVMLLFLYVLIGVAVWNQDYQYHT